MIAILSPAKTLDYQSPLPPLTESEARFAGDADHLAAAAAKLGKKKLASLMDISVKLATLNDDRFKTFADQPTRPALFAFAGDVYTGFEARSIDAPALDYAQAHVRLLSGLYGLLRPLDAIKPYRLEMGTRWAPRRKSLYSYWGTRIADQLTDDLRAEGSTTILNLASQEYWHAVSGKLPRDIRVVEVDFREPGPDGPRFISFNAKRARGMMARWLCEHRIDDIDAMRGFDSDGYRFDAKSSEADCWRFTRA